MNKIFFSRCSLAYFAILCFWTLLPSCKKLVEIPAPVTSTNGAIVYNADGTSIGVVTSLYSRLVNSQYLTAPANLISIQLTAGLSADELTLFNTNNSDLILYAQNILSPTKSPLSWTKWYDEIYAANDAIEGLSGSTGVSSIVKTELTGEAKFMRAFAYFYLVNLYGDVPLATTTNYAVNAQLPRATVQTVYVQIVNDLKDAQSLLSNQYLDGTLKPYAANPERVRPTRAAATALLARVYLYQKNYQEAINQASSLISQNNLFSLVSLNDAFLKNNKEAIWQLQPTGKGNAANTLEGQEFIPINAIKSVYLSTNLINSFEPGDGRRSNWVGNFNGFAFPNKYKVGTTPTPSTEYSTVLRLAEQYLIRAEARIQLEQVADGITDLNLLRTRARESVSASVPNPLPPLSTSLSKSAALKALEHERQVELFTEWGHRWLDLKRLSGFDDSSKTRADEVLAPIKGSNWQTTDQLYPIPLMDIQRDINLRQNPGYN